MSDDASIVIAESVSVAVDVDLPTTTIEVSSSVITEAGVTTTPIDTLNVPLTIPEAAAAADVPTTVICPADISLDFNTLALLRNAAVSAIFSVAATLKIKSHVTSTACVFFHRFFSRCSLRAHDRLEVALACLMVAAKSTDFSVPLRVNRLVPELLLRQGFTACFEERSEAFVLGKERLIDAERLLLFVLEYDLGVVPPTRALDEALSSLTGPPDVLVRMAQSALHDVLKTTLPLTYSAPILARATLQFAHNSVAAAAQQTGSIYAAPEGWETVISLETLPVAAAQAIANEILAFIRATK